MEVKQIAQFLNEVSGEVLGRDPDTGEVNVKVREDLSDVVDMGNAIFDSNSTDKYVNALVDHIGKVVFVNRVYRGNAPRVLMDAWEYGAVLQKITVDTLPVAVNNADWNLQAGQSYDPFVFNPPAVSNKFYNRYVTFEIDVSYLRKQLRSAFDSADQINSFLSMIFNAVEKSITIKMDALVMRTISNMISHTLVDSALSTGMLPAPSADNATFIVPGDFSADNNNVSFSPRVINMRYLYNRTYPNSTIPTSAACWTNPAFIRFSAYQMGMYADRMSTLNNLLNVGAKDRFTDKDNLHIVMLSDFARAADVFLQSDVYHDEFTRLPSADIVPYWQSATPDADDLEPSDEGYNVYSSYNNSTIMTTVEWGNYKLGVSTSNIMACMFDRDALGVSNLERDTESIYNPKGSFFNNFFKFKAGYFNDLNEQFIVFICE